MLSPSHLGYLQPSTLNTAQGWLCSDPAAPATCSPSPWHRSPCCHPGTSPSCPSISDPQTRPPDHRQQALHSLPTLSPGRQEGAEEMLWRLRASAQALPLLRAHNQDILLMVFIFRREPVCPTDDVTALHTPSQQLEMLNAPIPHPTGTGGFWKPPAIRAPCPETLRAAAAFYSRWISPPFFTAFYNVLLIGFVELFYRLELFLTSAAWT